MRKWWARVIGAKGSVPKRVLPDWVPAYDWEYKGGKYYQWKWLCHILYIKKDANETSFRSYTSFGDVIQQFKEDYIKDDYHYSRFAPEFNATIVVLKSKDYAKYPKEFLGDKFIYSNYTESILYCFDKYVENAQWNIPFIPCRDVDRHYAGCAKLYRQHFKGTEHRPKWLSNIWWHEYYPYPGRGASKYVGYVISLLSGSYIAISELGEKKLLPSYAFAEMWLLENYPEAKQ